MRTLDDLRPAQIALIHEVQKHQDGVMVLGMGGGKTAAMLTAIKNLTDGIDLDRAIVLAPPRTLRSAWGKECSKWAHLQDMHVVIVDGTPARRRKVLEEGWLSAHVLVVSTDLTTWLIEWLDEEAHALDRTLLVIDELSRFKASAGKRRKKLLAMRDEFNGVWGLTGTPRPNGYEDMFQPLKLIGGPDVWGIQDFDIWRREYFKPLDYHHYRWEPHQFAIPILDRICQEFMVYAPVDDLQLPALYTGPDFEELVTLTEEQRHHYDNMMDHLVAQGVKLGLNGDELEEWLVVAMSQGVASMKMSQIVQGFLYQEDGDAVRLKENPKLEALADMDLSLGGDRGVITYGFREEISLLTELFKKRRRRVGLLGGGVSPKKAQETIDAFAAGKIDRLLLHPASAGHGVDGLQFGGHHMIWFHPTWSAEQYDQTVKRLHRPGQTQDVYNYKILAADTNDLTKVARTESKGEDQADFISKLRRAS